MLSTELESSPFTAHVCPEPGCDRQFSRKYALAEHVKSHTGERPHVCPVRTCGKRFTTSGNLSRHKRLHGYIEPLACPVEGCVCAFPSVNKLEKHMKFHYGEAGKICSVVGCGKTFSTTGNLNRHLKNHHGQEPVASPRESVGSPTSGEQVETEELHLDEFMVVGESLDIMQWEPMSDFFPTEPCGMFDDLWNPVVLDTLEVLLGDDA